MSRGRFQARSAHINPPGSPPPPPPRGKNRRGRSPYSTPPRAFFFFPRLVHRRVFEKLSPFTRVLFFHVSLFWGSGHAFWGFCMSAGAGKFKAGSLKRFWSRVHREGACWLWRGRIGPKGYPEITLSGVHGGQRIAWVWKHGEAPGGNLRNECGNRLCVNPAHWRDDGPKREDVAREAKAARQAEFERLGLEGLGIGEIARRMGCSRNTVWRRLKGVTGGPPVGEADD